MSDIVSFLRDDVVIKHYQSRLLRRIFTKWKFSLSKYHLLPSTSSALISACFTWIRTSFSETTSEDVPVHLFPFYAAIEGDGEDSAYFISRLRNYMIDKLELPHYNIPLLVHALAMFDARQLARSFNSWRDYCLQCRSLDGHARTGAAHRALRKWKAHTNAVVSIKLRQHVLKRESLYRTKRSAFTLWYALLQAIRYRRDVLQPRNTRACLMALVRHRITQQYQRVTLRNGIRFDLHKRLLWAYHNWLCRLNTIPTAQLVAKSEEIRTWLLALVRRNWLESQELRDIYISAFGQRSPYFRCHRFIASLALLPKVSGDGEDGGAPARPVPTTEYPSAGYFRFSTPARSVAHVSFNTIPQYEPTHINETLHSAALDATLFSPGDGELSVAGYRPMSPARTAWSARSGSPDVGRMPQAVLVGRAGASPTPSRLPAKSRSPSPGRTASATPTTAVPAAVTTLAGVRMNPSSRLAQGVLTLSAGRFNYMRSLLIAFHRWMHRVPQIKLDSPHTFALFFNPSTQRQVLQNLVVRCATMLHRPAYFYVVHKQLVYALRKWLHRAQRWRFLRTRAHHLRRTTVALQQTQAFGAWLVTAARFQQLHRTANRIVCNHFRRELWRAWFAWHYYYERTVLIRANNRELLRQRTEEIDRFVAEKGEKRSFQAQYSVLREWSLVVQDRKKARFILDMWRNTFGKRKLLAAWRQWWRQIHYHNVATEIKRVWQGFRVRKVLFPKQYRYLQRFRRQIPIYRNFYQRLVQRRTLATLRTYVRKLQDFRVVYMKRFHLRRAVKVLRAFALRCRRARRASVRAESTHASFDLRVALRRLVKLQRRARYGRLLDNAHVVRCKLQVLSQWKDALRRWTRALDVQRKCRKQLLRRGWRLLRRNCRVASRIRCWRTYRLRLRAKRLLRRWRQKIATYAEWKQRAVVQHNVRRFRTWFHWWWLQTVRHSKRHRRSTPDQRTVFFLKMRGGRHFQVIRGVISARVRWYMKKFIDFTSFRRRNRALLYTLSRSVRKTKLSAAFQKLMLESHRSSRQRRRLKIALGPEVSFARRQRHGGGIGGGASRNGGRASTDGPSLPSTGGLLGGMSAPRVSAPPPGNAPLRHPGGSLIFPVEVAAPTPRPRAPSDASGAMSLFSRLSRRQMHQNIRHVVSRHVPVSAAELRRRLQDNSAHTQEYCMCKRGFRNWLLFTRYNRRNARACKRIDQGFWSMTIDNALKHLYTKLLVHRRMRFRAKRVLTALHSAKLRDVLKVLFHNRRLRQRGNKAIKRMDEKWSAKFTKRFFTRLYTICFFRRYVRKVKCVKRLKTELRGAIKKLRFIAWHHLRSPAALAIKKMDLKKKKIAFKRLKKMVIKGKFRRALGRVAVQQRNTAMAVSTLRFWREFTRRKQALKRIVRRFTLVPALRLWLASATTLQRHHRAVTAMQHRLHRHTKCDVFVAWRRVAAYRAAVRRRGAQLQHATTRRHKRQLLYTWLRNVDHKINENKYLAVVELHNYHLAKRTMFHWHKTSLISEMCTWRSSKSAIRNWHLSARISRKLRLSYARAERFADAYVATAYLLLWYKRMARRLLLNRRHNKALRLRQLRKYLMYFRTWKRRMYLVYRERNFLSALQQNTPLFNLRRSLRIWHRVARITRRSTRKRTQLTILQRWRSYCHKKRFSRIGFLDRLAQFRRRELLTKPFFALVSNCKSLRLQRTLFAYTTMTTKSKVWSFWRRLYHMRLQEKQSLRLVFKGLYQHNVFRCFRTWRIHTTVFSPLLQRNAVNHAWHNWKLAYVAQRKYKSYLLNRVLSAWKKYFFSIDAAKMLLLKKRRALWRIMLKKIRDDHLKQAVCLQRLRTGDEALRLCDFRQHSHLLHSTHTATLALRFPLTQLYRGMDDSVAGRNLTMSMLDVTQVSISSFQRGPAPRVLALQLRLRERFAAADGRPLADFDAGSTIIPNDTFRTTFKSTFRTTFKGAATPPATAASAGGTRYHSPGTKGSAQRPYAAEAKGTTRSAEPLHRHRSPPQSRSERMREHVHALFSPPKITPTAELNAPPAASLQHVITSPTALTTHTHVPVSTQRGPAQAPSGPVSMAMDVSYVPAARLFSPQGASPFASDITPYQAPRQRAAGTLPTGDLRSVQTKGRSLHTREML